MVGTGRDRRRRLLPRQHRVSLRLLLLARRTRALPELLIGFGLLVLGSIGYPIAIAVETTGDTPTLQTRVQRGARPAPDARPGRHHRVHVARVPARHGWARALVYRVLRGRRALAAAQVAAPGWAAFAASKTGPWQHLPFFTLFSLFWAGGEAMLYHRKLVRRLALGLADAVATNRMCALVASILSAFAISAIVSAMRMLGHIFQAYFCLPDGFAPGLIRFNNQDDSIGQLSHQDCFTLMGKRRCADENVIKFLAQFGKARSTAFQVPVEVPFRRA